MKAEDSPKQDQKFEIMTLDVAKLIRFPKSFRSKGGKNEIRFELDFTNGFDKRAVLVSTESRNENALMRQLGLVMKPADPNSPDTYREHLCILGFEGAFKKSGPGEKFDSKEFEKTVKAGIGAKDIAELCNVIRRGGAKEKALFFLFKNGFTIKFDDKRSVCFVAFDSSSSMIKDSKVSFVDSEYKKKLDDRLLLGMDLKKAKIQVAPHKYFAYRGLYMSDAVRIDAGKDLELNEKTVVVVDDYISYYPKSKSLITADKNPESDG